jgi:FMN reductase
MVKPALAIILFAGNRLNRIRLAERTLPEATHSRYDFSIELEYEYFPISRVLSIYGWRRKQMVKFVGIAGSLRSDSYTQLALNLAGDRLAALGAEVEILDLRTMNLPFCDGGNSYPDYPDVERLQKAFLEADGFILATPEYHGSVSGVLKNALDLMSFDQLSGKVAGMISILGGQPNSNALNDLRVILRWVHTWVIPEQVAIGQAWKAFGADGKLLDEKISQRLDAFAQSLYENTRKLRGVA